MKRQKINKKEAGLAHLKTNWISKGPTLQIFNAVAIALLFFKMTEDFIRVDLRARHSTRSLQQDWAKSCRNLRTLSFILSMIRGFYCE